MNKKTNKFVDFEGFKKRMKDRFDKMMNDNVEIPPDEIENNKYEGNENSHYGMSFPPQINNSINKENNNNIGFVTTEKFEKTMDKAFHLGEMSLSNIEFLIRFLVESGIIDGQEYQDYLMNGSK